MINWQFSDTQWTVLNMSAFGWTDREIASELGMSPKTVVTHRHRMLRRSGAATWAQLLYEAGREKVFG